ncbi:hypothetical protein DUNSADRAFT_2664 [Dunaliella salina]|uniref:Uncharacterized protein n=1 Tax=Dunaliella salina TaxID=3046 RepID=A0ABQ7H873_DUNSA|nr:hypothetical protein DUNSADRAFT_2664 [Dunaliella salina]|eukprot:KAF5843051.1 hypothetical protein DUNSADRAFT_2664 [Dunaliella salina]
MTWMNSSVVGICGFEFTREREAMMYHTCLNRSATPRLSLFRPPLGDLDALGLYLGSLCELGNLHEHN